ncbi:MAG: hypothetical protein EHM87_22320 [Burkholderiales bacterium]|nr:MAG: hypothetical protein EHM87_22320 [Burkholderiales bacterium]
MQIPTSSRAVPHAVPHAVSPTASPTASPTVSPTVSPAASPTVSPTVSSRGPLARRLGAAAIGAALLLGVAPARAQWFVPGDQFRLSYGPSAYHFSHSPEHASYNHLVSGELLTQRWTVWGASRTQIGLALFDNSFGQFSQYLYVGQEWDLMKLAGGDLVVNATFGLLHGYKAPYEDKIPFNRFGTAPVIIPSIAWRYQRFSVFASVLGANGFLFGGSWTFDLVK